jgi:hypothetical protein
MFASLFELLSRSLENNLAVELILGAVFRGF